MAQPHWSLFTARLPDCTLKTREEQSYKLFRGHWEVDSESTKLKFAFSVRCFFVLQNLLHDRNIFFKDLQSIPNLPLEFTNRHFHEPFKFRLRTLVAQVQVGWST